MFYSILSFSGCLIIDEILKRVKPSECGYNNNSAPIFQNGLGKSILLKQSSIKKAMSVLKNVGSFETGDSLTGINST